MNISEALSGRAGIAGVQWALLGEESRAVVVNWTPGGGNRASVAEAATHAMERDAVERGLAAPFRSLHVGDPDWGMDISVSPLDPGFPQLVELSDPEAVRALIAAALGRLTDGAP